MTTYADDSENMKRCWHHGSNLLFLEFVGFFLSVMLISVQLVFRILKFLSRHVCIPTRAAQRRRFLSDIKLRPPFLLIHSPAVRLTNIRNRLIHLTCRLRLAVWLRVTGGCRPMWVTFVWRWWSKSTCDYWQLVLQLKKQIIEQVGAFMRSHARKSWNHVAGLLLLKGWLKSMRWWVGMGRWADGSLKLAIKIRSKFFFFSVRLTSGR